MAFPFGANMTKVKQLEKLFGGKWRYLGPAYWECDDGKHHVWAFGTINCDRDVFPDLLYSTDYQLFRDNKFMQHVYLS